MNRLRFCSPAGLRLVASLALAAVPLAAHAGTATEASAITPLSVAANMAAHRAVIDLKLVKATSSSNVASLNGRMVYEVTGSPCDGFSVNFRFVTRVRDTHGKSRVTDLRTTTYESGNGDRFDFLTQTFTNEEQTEKTRGSAEHTPDGVVVTLKEPEERTVDMPSGVVFPTAHLIEMVYHAMTGARFAALDLYDGSEGGEKVFPTSVAIGLEETGPDDFSGEPAADVPMLKGLRRWPASVAYYNGEAGPDGEQTPVYEMRFVLYENGVSRALSIDYGEFVLEGKVIELTPLEASPCNPSDVPDATK